MTAKRSTKKTPFRRSKNARCQSGLRGWRGYLRDNYKTFDAFADWDEMYGLSARLGFATSQEAWEANPLIEGSVLPSDYRVVPA